MNFKLFSRKKTIKNLNADDMRKERINLDNEERRVLKDLDRLKREDGQLLAEYAAAKGVNDVLQQNILGRKLQEVRSQIGAVDQRHGFLAKQVRVVNGLITIKENEAFFARIGAGSAINSMDLTELQMFVEEATRNGELTSDRLETLVGSMNEHNATMARSESDSGLGDFMASLDHELDARGMVAAPAADNSGLDAAISVLDREIAARRPVVADATPAPQAGDAVRDAGV